MRRSIDNAIVRTIFSKRYHRLSIQHLRAFFFFFLLLSPTASLYLFIISSTSFTVKIFILFLDYFRFSAKCKSSVARISLSFSFLFLFLFFFSFQARTHGFTHGLHRRNGRIEKNGLIHYHCNDGLTRGRGGEGNKREKKNGHGTDDRLEEGGETRRGEEAVFLLDKVEVHGTPRDDYPLVICTRSTRTMTDQLRFRDSLSRFQPLKPHRGATDGA